MPTVTSDQLRMAEALRESEARFRALFDQANDAIFMLHDGVFVDCNAKGLSMYHRTRDEILGRGMDEFSPSTQADGLASREKLAGLMAKALTGEAQFFEWVLSLPDGTLLQTEVSLNRLKLPGKVCLQAIARDITERKQAEARIAQQAALLDEVRDAIIVREINGTILFWNKGAERVYGWSHQEVVGRNVADVLHFSKDRLAQFNEWTISQGEWQGEVPHLTRDQRNLVVEVRLSLIRDHDGRPQFILGINTDVTERKKIEAQFMRAQRMETVGTLAGGVAHDLNNVLAPIMMSIEVLRQRATDPQSADILQTIAECSRRGAGIVRQLLSFARGLEGERIEVDLNDSIRNTEAIIRDTFPKSIRLGICLPDQCWKISGDSTLLHQVLLNLCLNARDAMPHGGRLNISVENVVLDAACVERQPEAKVGRYVLVGIEDSGTGISPDVIDKIFEPFFTTKAVGKGTGLGLSMVQAIVKSHRGFVQVESKPDQGTTFNVYFPAMETKLNRPREILPLNSLPRGNGEMVLIVDDEPSVLNVTSQTLIAFGYRTLTAPDGAEAMTVYLRHHHEIAVVLTDMAMPVMDGFATISALKKINPAIKVIVASGSISGDMAGDLAAGVRHFLAKPYTAETLLETMRMVLAEDSASVGSRRCP